MFDFLRKKSKSESENKLFFSTDIHCHIIPGVDDGSKNLSTSLELVERMHGWGIQRILATPHVTQDTFENNRQTITPPFEQLREAIAEKGLDIELGHAAEYRLDEFSVSQFNSGDTMTYPNNYLLIENSFVQEPLNFRQLLFELMLKDYRLVWAHPERYSYYYDKAKRKAYADIHGIGVKFQVNLLSLTGYYGKEQKRIAEELIEKGLVDFLGTDLHNHRHADAIEAYLASKDYRRHRQALEGKILNDKAF